MPFPVELMHYVAHLQATKDIPAVKEMLKEAKQVLGYDLLQLCTDGPKEKLDDTSYAQVLILEPHPRDADFSPRAHRGDRQQQWPIASKGASCFHQLPYTAGIPSAFEGTNVAISGTDAETLEVIPAC